MTNLRNRTSLVAAAIAATLALSACGDARDDRAATRTDSTASSTAPTTPSAPYASDRVTADASTATSRAGGESATPSTPAAKADTPVERAAATAGDAALTAKVKAALMAEPGIESMQIDVDTAGGRVTLSGEVDNAQHRQRALEVARGVDGVSGVVDRLSVKR